MIAVGMGLIVLGYAIVIAGLSKFLKFPPYNKPISVMQALGVGIDVAPAKK